MFLKAFQQALSKIPVRLHRIATQKQEKLTGTKQLWKLWDMKLLKNI